RFGSPIASLVVTGVALTGFCALRIGELIGIYALVQSLAYLLIYATLFKLRSKPDESDGAGFRIPLRTGGLLLIVLPSILIGAFVIQRSILPDGDLDARRSILHLLILASGPITYFLTRRRRGGLGGQGSSDFRSVEMKNPSPTSTK